MANPVWSYSTLRDGTLWKLLVAGAAGAVPAVLLLPVSWRVAVAARESSGEGRALAPLVLLPALLLSLWAALWWAAALRRVVRLRRLVRTGTQVQAHVRQLRLLHGNYGVVVGVVLWLEYEVGGRTYQAKKRTTLRGIAGRARESGLLELVVDPRAPKVAALVVEGALARLG